MYSPIFDFATTQRLKSIKRKKDIKRSDALLLTVLKNVSLDEINLLSLDDYAVALHAAIKQDNDVVFDKLLAADNLQERINHFSPRSKKTSLYTAVDLGRNRMASVLMAKGAITKLGKEKSTRHNAVYVARPLLAAINKNNLDGVSLLISGGAAVTDVQVNAAIARKNEDITDMVLDQLTDVQLANHLMAAIKSGNLDKSQVLIKKYIKDEKFDALYDAVMSVKHDETQTFFKRSATNKVLNKAIKIAKDEVINKIDASNNSNKRKNLCESVINHKESGISKIIFLQRGIRQCRLGHGALKAVQERLNSNVQALLEKNANLGQVFELPMDQHSPTKKCQ